jgi:hypothetical protein
MLLFYDNPKISTELSVKEAGNFLTQSHKRQIIDHFIEKEQEVSQRGIDRYKVHRDVAVYMPLRRIGLAANEKTKLNNYEKMLKEDPENDRLLSEEEIALLKERQIDSIEWLRSDVAYAIKSKDSGDPEPGKLYKTDKQLFEALNDIVQGLEIIP